MTSTNPILPREGPRDECGVFGVYAPESEVARLTSLLEGPQSPIEAILSADAARPAAAPNGTNGTSPSIARQSANGEAPKARAV